MRLLLLVVALTLTAKAARAQLVTPTTTYALAWDYTGPAFDHFEVRYATSSTWTKVGKAQQAAVPVIAVGSYTAQVRACRTAIPTTATCSLAALPFTVTAFVPSKPVAPGAPQWAK